MVQNSFIEDRFTKNVKQRPQRGERTTTPALNVWAAVEQANGTLKCKSFATGIVFEGQQEGSCNWNRVIQEQRNRR